MRKMVLSAVVAIVCLFATPSFGEVEKVTNVKKVFLGGRYDVVTLSQVSGATEIVVHEHNGTVFIYADVPEGSPMWVEFIHDWNPAVKIHVHSVEDINSGRSPEKHHVDFNEIGE